MPDLTHREFIRQSILLTSRMAFVSCEDDYAETGRDSPGKLSRNQLSKKVIIIGQGLSGLVAGYGSITSGFC